MIDYLIARIHSVKTDFPDDHMEYMGSGGFDVPLSDAYDPLEIFIIRHYAKYIRALVLHRIEPIRDWQTGYAEAAEGKKEPTHEGESAWLKFVADYPDWATLP